MVLISDTVLRIIFKVFSSSSSILGPTVTIYIMEVYLLIFIKLHTRHCLSGFFVILFSLYSIMLYSFKFTQFRTYVVYNAPVGGATKKRKNLPRFMLV